MNNFYTYELCSSATPWLPFYIGKGCNKRMYVHENLSLKKEHYNKHLQNKILKILKEGNTIHYHKFNDNVSAEDAINCEIIAIATFKAAGVKLCNYTDGGEGLLNPSKETHIRLSNAAKLRNPMSEETKKKISLSTKGKPKPQRSLDHCKHISESAKHRPSVTDEWKYNHSKKMKGRKVSLETKNKISENAKINPNYGFKNKHHTKEFIEKISGKNNGRK